MLDLELYVEAVLLVDHLVNFGSELFAQLIGGHSHAKSVVSDFENVFKFWLDVIINVVHAEVEVLELRILDSHPDLLGLSIFIFLGDLLNIIQLWNRLLWLFRGLQLLVLLNDGISLLKLS